MIFRKNVVFSCKSVITYLWCTYMYRNGWKKYAHSHFSTIENSDKPCQKLLRQTWSYCQNFSKIKLWYASPPPFNVVRLQGHEMWQQLSQHWMAGGEGEGAAYHSITFFSSYFNICLNTFGKDCLKMWNHAMKLIGYHSQFF